MATIIRHKENGQKYVLIGSGFGAFQSKKPHWFFGNLQSDTEEGQYAMVCVCDSAGNIGWLESSDVVVETVDGQPVQSLF